MDADYIMGLLDSVSSLYQDIILTSNYCRVNEMITWNKYTPGISNKILYAKEYERLLNDRQYSFLFKDKSFVQFYYGFDEEGVNKCKLCYYPYPIGNSESPEELEEYFSESGTDILETYYYGVVELKNIGVISTNNSHFRFDYDKSVVAHSKSHAQYGGINDLRIPFTHIIDPLLFMEFIVINSPLFEDVKDLMGGREFQDIKGVSISKIIPVEVGDGSGIHLDYK